MTERRKSLIEVAFPLEEVSDDSRRDTNRSSPHPQVIHKWWARRPLAACRAFIYASLVDDPGTDAERDALLREVADLASWSAVRHPDRVVRNPEDGGSGLKGAELLERARERILACNDGTPPKLLDPFAGGGAIPLEGLRLGCEVEASDLNPVAVLILKCTLEYPQRYGQPNSRDVPQYILDADAAGAQPGMADGEWAATYRRNPLATDVRYWATWMLERARDALAEFYPPDADGSIPVAYLWSRTIPCPSCEAEMPLLRQYWLARRPQKRVALEPVIDRSAQKIEFRVVEGDAVSGTPERATTSRGDTQCLLCHQVVKAAQIHEIGRAGNLSARMTAVVLAPRANEGKRYRPANEGDMSVFALAMTRLLSSPELAQSDYAVIPDEPVSYHPQYMLVREYGIDEWGKLFNSRQLLAMTTFARLVNASHQQMMAQGLDEEYAKAVATYLGVALDRQATRSCTTSFWDAGGESINGLFARQALPMVWDYPECTPLVSSASGAWWTNVEYLAKCIEAQSFEALPSKIAMRNACEGTESTHSIIVTDPPYYDSINYADLSDFFYVWMKRSVGFLHPELLALPLTPKREQIVMNAYAEGPENAPMSADAARQHYVDGMALAFESIANSLEDNCLTGVVFAHTAPDAWATLTKGLLDASLVPVSSWPIDTERQTGLKVVGQARLSTSVWMACRKRGERAEEAFLSDVLEDMKPVIRERLLFFWSQGIRGADFFISAIGPALSVFGRHSRVLNVDDSEVSVRDFLDIVRRESTAVALEQVLHGADLGVVDSLTQQYVTWVWSYSRAALDAGEALALCLATGTRLDDVTRDHSIAVTAKQRSKKVVKLRTIAERGREDDDFGGESSGRTVALIDQLQCAALLWGQNQSDRLGKYRSALGESRWSAVLTLGQAVASCLPEGDEDRRVILGLLGATVRPTEAPDPNPQLPLGMDEGDGTD